MKRRFGHRHTQRDSRVRTQEWDGRLYTKDRGLRRNQPCSQLPLRLLTSRTGREQISVVKPPRLWCFVIAARANESTRNLGFLILAKSSSNLDWQFADFTGQWIARAVQ